MLNFDLPIECVNMSAVKKVIEQNGKEVFSITLSKELYDNLPNKIKMTAKVY